MVWLCNVYVCVFEILGGFPNEWMALNGVGDLSEIWGKVGKCFPPADIQKAKVKSNSPAVFFFFT